MIAGVCGKMEPESMQTVTNPLGGFEERVIIVTSTAWQKFRDIILTPIYISFLTLILILWHVAMLDEVNTTLIWWNFLIDNWFAKAEDPEQPVLTSTDDSIEVGILPRRYICIVALTNLFPRTVICGVTTFFGSLFLCQAQSYSELVMNSLAMTFLVTIDDMMFAAFVPSVRRAWIERCAPLSFPMLQIGHVCGNELVALVAVMVASGATMWISYNHPYYGHRENARYIRCLCQVEGVDCWAAWRLGGYSAVEANPRFA